MATLKVTFVGSTPPPNNGYRITYAPAGSPDNLFVAVTPNPMSTVVYIPGAIDGVSYTVRVQNDCGNGNLGPVVEYTAATPTCAELVINSGSGRVSYTRCDGTSVNNLYVVGGVPISDCVRQNTLQILEGTISWNWGNQCAGTIV